MIKSLRWHTDKPTWVIKTGFSCDPSQRAKGLSAKLVWSHDGDGLDELNLFWCAAQYLKLSISLLGDSIPLRGHTEMYGNFETEEQAKNYIDIIARRYATDFS